MRLGDSIAASDLASTAGRSSHLQDKLVVELSMPSGVFCSGQSLKMLDSDAQLLFAPMMGDHVDWAWPESTVGGETMDERVASDVSVAERPVDRTLKDPTRCLVSAIFDRVRQAAGIDHQLHLTGAAR